MTNPASPVIALLAELAVRDVNLRADGDRLLCRPRSAVTDLLARRIMDNKRELLTLLAGVGDRMFSAAELVVFARAGARPAECPLLLAAKDAFAGLGGLTLTAIETGGGGDTP